MSQKAFNPYDISTFPYASFKFNGVEWFYLDCLPKNYNPETSPTALCLHGFPDHSYGFRHIIPHLTARGFRVLVPDFPGCGKTVAPGAKEADIETRRKYYSTKARCDGLVALLDHTGTTQCSIVMHDWGAHTGWRFALYYPERCSSLAAVCVPFTPPQKEWMSLENAQKINSRLNYQVSVFSALKLRDQTREAARKSDGNVLRSGCVFVGHVY